MRAFRLQPRGHAGGPRRAIGFAEEVFGRIPPLMDGQESHDALREGVDVGIGGEERLGLGVAQRPRVAGVDGVQEDDVGLRKHGGVVVDQAMRRVRRHVRGIDHHPPGPERGHVQPHAR